MQLKARGNGLPSHKRWKPRHRLVVVQSLLTAAQRGCHLHKDNGARSFQGSVKQDILAPVPSEEVLLLDSPAGNTSNETLELGCYQVNGRCLELPWSNCSVYSQVHSKPQSRRQYLLQGQEGKAVHMLHLHKNSGSGLVTLASQSRSLGMEPWVAQNSSSWSYSQDMVAVPGGLPRLCSLLPRRLPRGSSHRHLRLRPARWSRPGRPRALARKPEAGEAPDEEGGIRAEVRAPGHRLPRARSSGRKKGRHWGRSPSASGPTWAPLPRSASRPPRPSHCAGACGRPLLASGGGG